MGGNVSSAMKPFSMISAVTKTNRGIGFKNTLPWHYKEDLSHFSKITTTTTDPNKINAVIMGRNTWESLPEKYRPLPKRMNIVLSRKDLIYHMAMDPNTNNMFFSYDDYHVCTSLNKTLEVLAKNPNIEQAFVIGGQQVYEEGISRCDKIYLTEIDDTKKPFECDRFFPEIPMYYRVVEKLQSKTSPLIFKTYQDLRHKNSEEMQYMNLLTEIMEKGEERIDRTGTGTIGLFGKQLTFDLRDDVLPLLTTKRVWYKGVIEELLFFLRGDHDNKKLQAKGVHIWDGNTSREYLDKYNKQHIETDDLGLAYGVQWRAAGAPLKGINADYRGKGIDQIQYCIDLIRNNPKSRRILFHAWNVQQLNDMSLVPCHLMYQFYVSQEEGTLSCMMTQRSVDVFLGLSFNIASVATLTRLIAKVCNLKPGKIVLNLGDTHIYKNHLEQVKEQLDRPTLYFPKLKIIPELNSIEDIEKLAYEDFELEGYYPLPAIKAKMAI